MGGEGGKIVVLLKGVITRFCWGDERFAASDPSAGERVTVKKGKVPNQKRRRGGKAYSFRNRPSFGKGPKAEKERGRGKKIEREKKKNGGRKGRVATGIFFSLQEKKSFVRRTKRKRTCRSERQNWRSRSRGVEICTNPNRE